MLTDEREDIHWKLANLVVTKISGNISSLSRSITDGTVCLKTSYSPRQYTCLNSIFRRFIKEGWRSSWINVRYPDGRIFISQWLETGLTAPGELPGEIKKNANIPIKLSKLKKNILTYTMMLKLWNSLSKLSPNGWLNLTNWSRHCCNTIQAANGIKPVLHEPWKR